MRWMHEQKLNWENFRQEGKTKKKENGQRERDKAEEKFAVGNFFPHHHRRRSRCSCRLCTAFASHLVHSNIYPYLRAFLQQFISE